MIADLYSDFSAQSQHDACGPVNVYAHVLSTVLMYPLLLTLPFLEP